jgi:hypothetical protein
MFGLSNIIACVNGPNDKFVGEGCVRGRGLSSRAHRFAGVIYGQN